jgi:D-serine deaminase-like pyridoxal phosphate-dependent protein
MRVMDVSTPAVVVDLDIVERNLDAMAGYCRAHGLGLRPHTKTHKMLEVARMQLERGALGLTVAKVGEAAVMARSGTREVLVAHPLYGDETLRRLVALPRELELLVSLDSVAAAAALSRIAEESGRDIGVLIEFDSGSKRCGVAAGEEAAELGKAVDALPGVRVRALMTYFGSIWGNAQERKAGLARAADDVARARRAFERAGLSLEIVSAGSTPAAALSHRIPGLTEIRPGTYVFNDLNTFYQGLCGLENCAVRVITTVVSTAVPGQAIVDAGSKVFSSDLLGAGPRRGHGLVVESDGAIVARLNEEHGFLEPAQGESFHVGQVLSVIPNHVCTCINMHDEIYVARGGEVLGTWQVAARGKVR